jgi:ABC-type lipoprotein release transport system permease subunit
LKATDPLTLGFAIGGMALVAMVASLLPAQRASKLQPMAALREE